MGMKTKSLTQRRIGKQPIIDANCHAADAVQAFMEDVWDKHMSDTLPNENIHLTAYLEELDRIVDYLRGKADMTTGLDRF